MKNIILNYLMNLIVRDTNYDEVRLQEIRYGLEAIYLNVSKLLIYFIINALIGNFINSLLFFLFFIPIKSFCWGFHAKKSWQCWIISGIGFIGLAFLSNYIYLNLSVKIILISCFLLAMWCWAPADTPKRPLINKRTRTILCTGALIITSLYSILIIIDTGFANILVLVLLYQCFLINPFTYMAFNTQYNNYLYYKEDRN